MSGKYLLYNIDGKLFMDENGNRTNKQIKYDFVTQQNAKKFSYYNDEIGEFMNITPVLGNKKTKIEKNYFDNFQTTKQKKDRQDNKIKREDIRKKRENAKKELEQKLKDAENAQKQLTNNNVKITDLLNQNQQYEQQITNIKKENETNINTINELKKQAEITKTQAKKEIEDLKQEFNIYKINQEKILIDKTNEIENMKSNIITEYKTEMQKIKSDYNNQVISVSKNDIKRIAKIFKNKWDDRENYYQKLIQTQNNEIFKIKKDMNLKINEKKNETQTKIDMINDKPHNIVSFNKDYDFKFDPQQKKEFIYYSVGPNLMAPVIFTLPKDVVPYKSYNIINNDVNKIVGINVNTKEIKTIDINIDQEKKILEKQPEEIKNKVIVNIDTNELPKQIKYQRDNKKGFWPIAKYSLPKNFIPNKFELIPNDTFNKQKKIWQINGTINNVPSTFIFSIDAEKRAAKNAGVKITSLM